METIFSYFHMTLVIQFVFSLVEMMLMRAMWITIGTSYICKLAPLFIKNLAILFENFRVRISISCCLCSCNYCPNEQAGFINKYCDAKYIRMNCEIECLILQKKREIAREL